MICVENIMKQRHSFLLSICTAIAAILKPES